MPMYEYHCRNCGTTFEMLRSTRDSDADVACPQCGKQAAEKLLSWCRGKVEMSMSDLQSIADATAGSGGGCAGCTAASCSTCGSK